MNWIRFALWMSALYVVYYGAIILWDYLRSKKLPGEEQSAVLTFEEHSGPVRELPDPQPEIYDSSVLSSGGVSLRQLFSIAREEAIEYTRPVSY